MTVEKENIAGDATTFNWKCYKRRGINIKRLGHWKRFFPQTCFLSQVKKIKNKLLLKKEEEERRARGLCVISRRRKMNGIIAHWSRKWDMGEYRQSNRISFLFFKAQHKRRDRKLWKEQHKKNKTKRADRRGCSWRSKDTEGFPENKKNNKLDGHHVISISLAERKRWGKAPNTYTQYIIYIYICTTPTYII